MEQDLGTKLDWVAVDHFNTGHPHTHVVLRGKNDRGTDLVIAREYIAHGLRERAIDIVNPDLGPRTDLEIEERLRSDVHEERLTVIDRRLIRGMDDMRLVSASDRAPFQQSRSEEHKAELQSLLRTSYAFFYLQYKIDHKNKK